jgi:hypothetical protein
MAGGRTVRSSHMTWHPTLCMSDMCVEGDEAVTAIRKWLDEHPAARLVVVDVLTVNAA